MTLSLIFPPNVILVRFVGSFVSIPLCSVQIIYCSLVYYLCGVANVSLLSNIMWQSFLEILQYLDCFSIVQNFQSIKVWTWPVCVMCIPSDGCSILNYSHGSCWSAGHGHGQIQCNLSMSVKCIGLIMNWLRNDELHFV